MSLRGELDEQYKIDVLAAEAGGYFSVPSQEGMDYTDLFFSVCLQFRIRYSRATPKERCFVEEVTRVTRAIQQGRRSARPFVPRSAREGRCLPPDPHADPPRE